MSDTPRDDPLPASICHLLFTPLLVTGMLKDRLTAQFQAGLVEDIALRGGVDPDALGKIWRPDDTTGIMIEAWGRWRPELTERRPAVVIKQNAYRSQPSGIGNRAQGNPTDRIGNPHYSQLWVGSHTLFCLGGNAAQATVLASEVTRGLSQFASRIIASLGLHRLQVVEFGGQARLEEHTETAVVPVTVGCAFEDRWVLVQQAPRLSRVSLRTVLSF